jgi:predicted TIM-barrel fold metal-dependent hydrolase
MRIVDTHLHLIDPDRLSYPWLAGAPALRGRWDLARYRAEADALGIATRVHMEVDVAEAQIDRETALVAETDGVDALVAACRPEAADFPAWLDRQREGKLRGLRRVLHVAPRETMSRPLFAENLRRLAPRALTFDLVITPEQHAEAARLIDACPDTAFVLDHCGNPDVKGGGLAPWRATLRELARRPNLVVKVSGIVANAAPGWTAATLRPYVETTIDLFGWDRALWGSDWPVCTLTGGTLSAWVEAAQSLVAGCSEGERARLFHLSAERVYRLPPPPAETSGG